MISKYMQTANLDFLERTSKELPLVPACFQPYFVADISFQKKLVYYSFSTRIAGGNIQDRAPLSYVSYRSPPIFFRMLLVSLVVSTLFALLFPSPSPPFPNNFPHLTSPLCWLPLSCTLPGDFRFFFLCLLSQTPFLVFISHSSGIERTKEKHGTHSFFLLFFHLFLSFSSFSQNDPLKYRLVCDDGRKKSGTR